MSSMSGSRPASVKSARSARRQESPAGCSGRRNSRIQSNPEAIPANRSRADRILRSLSQIRKFNSCAVFHGPSTGTGLLLPRVMPTHQTAKPTWRVSSVATTQGFSPESRLALLQLASTRRWLLPPLREDLPGVAAGHLGRCLLSSCWHPFESAQTASC